MRPKITTLFLRYSLRFILTVIVTTKLVWSVLFWHNLWIRMIRLKIMNVFQTRHKFVFSFSPLVFMRLIIPQAIVTEVGTDLGHKSSLPRLKGVCLFRGWSYKRNLALKKLPLVFNSLILKCMYFSLNYNNTVVKSKLNNCTIGKLSNN